MQDYLRSLRQRSLHGALAATAAAATAAAVAATAAAPAAAVAATAAAVAQSVLPPFWLEILLQSLVLHPADAATVAQPTAAATIAALVLRPLGLPL